MDDRLRPAFDALLHRTPEPPTWSDIASAHAVDHPPRRRLGPMAAVAAAVVVLVVIGGTVGLLRNTSLLGGAATVDHVRLSWSQAVEMRCLGMESIDNGGFDEATIDLWGPNRDGFVRADMTAPDGTVERHVGQLDDEGIIVRTWAAIGRFEPFEDATVFHDSSCVARDIAQSTSYGMAGAPYHPFAAHPASAFLPASPDPDAAGLAGLVGDDIVSWQERATDVRPASFDGRAVTVYVRIDDSTDELGDGSSRRERWVDDASGSVVREVTDVDSEVLGRVTTTVELVERTVVPAADVDFSVDDLRLLADRSQVERSDPVSTTTSIAPTDHPLMDEAQEIDADEIFTDDLAAVIDPLPGDQLHRIPVEDDEFALIVRLRPGARPHLYSTACGVLVLVTLPPGWDGTCLEVTVDGERRTGPFRYAEAVTMLDR